MVTILVKSGTQDRQGKRNGGHVSPFRASPVLELPDALPQRIQIDGFLGKFKNRPSAGEEEDATLTSVLREVINDDFPNYSIGYIVDGQGQTRPILDPGYGCYRFAVGARLEMLHNQYGIGPHILWLLDNAPLAMMMPDQVEREFLALHYGQSDNAQDRLWDTTKPQITTGLFPKWIHDPTPLDELPDNLPPRLSSILRACRVEDWDDPWDEDHNETEIGWWPLAVLCWYGFEPYQTNRTRMLVRNNYNWATGPQVRQEELDDRMPDQSQGGDPSWLVLDHLMEMNQNYIHCTCMPEVHTFDAAENLLYAFDPFYQLLNYISHART